MFSGNNNFCFGKINFIAFNKFSNHSYFVEEILKILFFLGIHIFVSKSVFVKTLKIGTDTFSKIFSIYFSSSQ
jgi:hypothetical protein